MSFLYLKKIVEPKVTTQVKHITKGSSITDMKIDCDIKPVTNIINTNCRRTVTDSTLCWKSHIDQIIPKLNAAC